MPVVVEPRVLVEDKARGHRGTSGRGSSDNRLVRGDNLLALKALESEFAGRVRCIYIDPPYNTGAAFEHYKDGLKHSAWLNLMRPRLELLWRLLAADGLLAVQIDDNEFCRLFLLMAELFGEDNLKVIVVKMSEASGVKMASVKRDGTVAKYKEYIVLAGKGGVRGLDIEPIPKESWDDEYRTLVSGATHEELASLRTYMAKGPTRHFADSHAAAIAGRLSFGPASAEYSSTTGISSPPTAKWLTENAWRIVRMAAVSAKTKIEMDARRTLVDKHAGAFIFHTPTGLRYLVSNLYDMGATRPRVQILFAIDYLSVHPGDLWTDIKTTGIAAEGGVDFKNGKKPEELLRRIVAMSTKPGDWVLDSFAGSGTTAAVAHKMGRRWIAVEEGEHCLSHIIPRMTRVVDGADATGITSKVGWPGGGGFRYFDLAPSLLKTDTSGRWVLDPRYDADMLAAAVCMHEGFVYEPSPQEYWIHGHSSERDHIWVTTQTLDHEQIAALCAIVGPSRTLLICCAAYDRGGVRPRNLTFKKIPKSLLSACEFGRDDYRLPATDTCDEGVDDCEIPEEA